MTAPGVLERRTPEEAVGVLDIGGTHVTAGHVVAADVQRGPGGRGGPGGTACGDGAGRADREVHGVHRVTLDADAGREEILDRIVEATATVGPLPLWGVAIPGPFDYADGRGSFAGVGKFAALGGVDLRAELTQRLAGRPRVVFVNDADAFGLGEAIAGAGAGRRRSVCLTLGTGVGSAFIADGAPVNSGPTVPPDGSAHLLTWRGRGLEDTVSRRAIRAGYARATGTQLDVKEIAQRAGRGEQAASSVIDHAFCALGATIAPWLRSFDAEVLVLGGSIGRSFAVVSGPLRRGLLMAEPSLAVQIEPARRPETAALLGAAAQALHLAGSTVDR